MLLSPPIRTKLEVVVSKVGGISIFSPFIRSDTASHLRHAKHLGESNFFSADGVKPSARRELLYPLFIASLYKAGIIKSFEMTNDRNLVPVLLVQFLLFSAAVFFLAMTYLPLIGTKLSLVAGTVLFMYIPISINQYILMSEVFNIFFISLNLYLLSIFFKSKKQKYLVLSFIVLALLTYAKSIYLLYAVFLMMVLLFTKKAKYKPLLISISIFTLLISMWVIRHYAQFDRMVIMTTDGASSFYRGNIEPFSKPAHEYELKAANWGDDYSKTDIEKYDHYKDLIKKNILTKPIFELVQSFVYKAMILIGGDITKLESGRKFIMFSFRLSFIIICLWAGIKYFPRTEIMWVLFAHAFYVTSIYTLFFAETRYSLPMRFTLFPLFIFGSLTILENIMKIIRPK